MIDFQRLHQRQRVIKESSKASSKTKSHSSKSLRRISKSSTLGSCKSDKIEGKVKLEDLLAQEAFFEKRQQVENEAPRLRMQEKRAKARRRKVIARRNIGKSSTIFIFHANQEGEF